MLKSVANIMLANAEYKLPSLVNDKLSKPRAPKVMKEAKLPKLEKSFLPPINSVMAVRECEIPECSMYLTELPKIKRRKFKRQLKKININEERILRQKTKVLSVALVSYSHAAAWLVICAGLNVRNWMHKKLKEHKNLKDKLEKIRQRSAISRITLLLLPRVKKAQIRAANIAAVCKLHGWRLMLMARIKRKKFAANYITEFLREYLRYKIPVYVSRFRFNAVKLQRYIRTYQAVTAARQKVLYMLWTKLEKRFTVKELPGLLERAEELRMRAALQKPADIEMEEVSAINVESRFFPRLVRDVNNATMKLNELKYTMVKGKLMMDRYPMRVADKHPRAKTYEEIMARVRVVAAFLQRIRKEYKVANEGKKIVHHKSLMATIDDAKALVMRSNGSDSHDRVNFVSVRANFMPLYSGRPRQKLRRLMEDYVCREHGLRTKANTL